MLEINNKIFHKHVEIAATLMHINVDFVFFTVFTIYFFSLSLIILKDKKPYQYAKLMATLQKIDNFIKVKHPLIFKTLKVIYILSSALIGGAAALYIAYIINFPPYALNVTYLVEFWPYLTLFSIIVIHTNQPPQTNNKRLRDILELMFLTYGENYNGPCASIVGFFLRQCGKLCQGLPWFLYYFSLMVYVINCLWFLFKLTCILV